MTLFRHLSRRRTLAALVAASLAGSLISHPVFAADGRLVGTVTDGSGATRLAGAIVRIDGRQASTGNDGRFTFNALPEGTYTLTVEFLGAGTETREVVIRPDQTVNETIRLGEDVIRLENILVVGQLASSSRALNRQRAADNLINVISADAIGQLPDANVTEALQRAPGVFIERDQGEGRFFGIRGIAPDLNATTINGLNLTAPEDDRRAVALDVVPSDIIGSLKISKTLTPDMEGNAIGGAVDVEGLSGFDREGRTLNIFGEASYSDLVDKTSPKFGVTYTDTFADETFAIAASLSWFDRDFGSDNQESGGAWKNDLENVDGAEFTGMEEIEQRDYLVNRERLGLALNFDWRASETTELYLRTLYSEFSDDELRLRNTWAFEEGDAVIGTDTSARWEGAEMERDLRDRFEEQTITSLVLGGQSLIGNRWTWDYKLGYSLADETEPKASSYVFKGEDFTLGYDGIGEVVNLIGSDDAFDGDNFELDEVGLENNFTEDKARSFQLDGQYDINTEAYPGFIKFGLLGRARTKTAIADIDVYDGGFDDVLLSQFATSPPDYGLGRFGPGLDAAALEAFVLANLDSFERDDDSSLIDSNGENFDIDEDVYAAYLMSQVDFIDFRLVYGVRYEDTDVSNRASVVVADGVTGDLVLEEQSTSSSYDNWLPSVNLTWAPGNDIIVRAAYFESLARPLFSQLRFGGVVEIDEDDGETSLEAEVGNPNLLPTEASNFDLAVEWYTGGIGILSGGIFYKDLENIIVTADVTDTFDLEDIAPGIPIDDAEIVQPINGSSGEIFGAEFNWVKQFDSLPAPWNGLIASANLTWSDSEATVSGRDEKIDLPLTSDLIWNLAVGYESGRTSIRLAGTSRDERLLELGGDPEEDLYEDKHLQWDFSAKYFITDKIQIFASIINITDEPFYAYQAEPRFNAQYEEYGRTYSLGLRWTTAN